MLPGDLLGLVLVLDARWQGGEGGSGLDAELTLYAEGQVYEALAAVGPELRFWFITSEARLESLQSKSANAVEAKLEDGETLWIEARPSTHIKCERCWRYTTDVGDESSYPTVCLRCAEALEAISFPPYPKPADSTTPEATA